MDNNNNNNVEHPNHYNREGGMECINEMLLIFGLQAVKSFCLLNVWKYRYRAADKNGMEDLKKSDYYLRLFDELCAMEQKQMQSQGQDNVNENN